MSEEVVQPAAKRSKLEKYVEGFSCCDNCYSRLLNQEKVDRFDRMFALLNKWNKHQESHKQDAEQLIKELSVIAKI